ncbi:MAG: TIGR02530 family flagellar biosynthesis protein [Bdellovibrionales bacterium]
MVNNQNLQLQQIQSITGVNKPVAKPGIQQENGTNLGPSFSDVLAKQKPNTLAAPTTEAATALKFSGHAIDRMRSRGIQLAPEKLEKMASAIDKAEAKGAKDTLVMAGDSAFIVNVKNRTVITALDTAQMKENVFTKIDSTVLI